MAPKIKTFRNNMLGKTLTGLIVLAVLAIASVCFPLTKGFADPAPLQRLENNSTSPQTVPSDPNCNNSSDAGVQKCIDNNQITKDINLVVNFLSAGVGIIVIGVIILGGIQYSLAGDNSTATGAAKQRIINGLIALFVFIFAFTFLQWLIPGGVFK
jgi:hypothetical protein